MKKRPGQRHESDNADRWLLTYADLVTLLLGLFVILYAMSKIDVGRYNIAIATLSGVFGKTPSGVLSGSANAIEPPVPDMFRSRRVVTTSLEGVLALDTRNGTIFLSHNERGVTVHIMDELLFGSGSAIVKTAAKAILDSLSSVLKELPFDIRVEGHTDDVPIKTSTFPSNWHLSVARAVNTAHYLISENGVAPERVSVVGYADYHPIAPNDSETLRRRNRRVDIVIITDIPKER